MYRILSRAKDLNGPVLGNRVLNRLGLHKSRVTLADRCNQMRRRAAVEALGTQGKVLAEQGYLAIPDFLPAQQFLALLTEAEAATEKAHMDFPASTGVGKRFGGKQMYPWGFDRYDGGTLNRFIEIDPLAHKVASTFSKNPVLSALSSAISGGRQKSKYVWFYLTLHGDQEKASDPQKEFHRDTFFSSMKFWYFLRPVTAEEGAFEYVPGSHVLTADRLDWEHEMTMRTMERAKGKRSSSFRITEDKLRAMGMPDADKMIVPANTLVIADTFGFHRRGMAQANTARLALYGNMRPWPFSPVVL